LFRFNFVITPEMFSFEVTLQWAEEIKVFRFKVRAVWWMGKIFPAQLLQELRCDTDRAGQKRRALSEVAPRSGCSGVQLLSPRGPVLESRRYEEFRGLLPHRDSAVGIATGYGLDD
jgi:hypothetical protein